MLDNIINFFRKIFGAEQKTDKSKDTAKERLHLVLIQDRASVSADFLEAMKQEIIDVIKKYIEIDENAIDVRLTNKTNEDGTNGSPALYANIPITNVKATVIAKTEEISTNEEQKVEDEPEKEEKLNKEVQEAEKQNSEIVGVEEIKEKTN